MFKLYLLIRLGMIDNLFVAAIMFCLISALICFIIAITKGNWADDDDISSEFRDFFNI